MAIKTCHWSSILARSRQCGEADFNDLKLRLFVHSLIGLAFSWFANQLPYLVRNWKEMKCPGWTKFPVIQLEPIYSSLIQRKDNHESGHRALTEASTSMVDVHFPTQIPQKSNSCRQKADLTTTDVSGKRKKKSSSFETQMVDTHFPTQIP